MRYIVVATLCRSAVLVVLSLALFACSSPPTPLPAISPTHRPTPAPSPTATTAPPTLTVVREEMDKRGRESPKESLFDALLRPFIYEAAKRREANARKDPEQTQRLDKELNDDRINFLLYGYGESHEPPVTERAIVGSNTIISYNTRTRTVDLISFTHDIRVPEVERELLARGQKVHAVRMDQAYPVGGFRLMRKTLENMTGLAMDFQVTFKDAIILRFVDNVLGGLEIQVPETFTAHPFYLDGKKYPEARFVKGKQKMNGNQVIQYIKTTPVTQGYYGKSLELNVRKHQVLTALLDAMRLHSADRGFWLKSSAFLTAELVTGAVVLDFDPIPLATNNVGSLLADFNRFVGKDKSTSLGLPSMNRSTYIADPSNGDGGVRWVDGDLGNPHTKRDLQTGVYPPGLGVVIPFDANANGDLVTEYWTSVRQHVKKFLIDQGTRQ